jgi:hypothetical protein
LTFLPRQIAIRMPPSRMQEISAGIRSIPEGLEHMPSFKEESKSAALLLDLLGIAATRLSDPKIEFGEETGVDVLCNIDGRKIGVQASFRDADSKLLLERTVPTLSQARHHVLCLELLSFVHLARIFFARASRAAASPSLLAASGLMARNAFPASPAEAALPASSARPNRPIKSRSSFP